MREVDLIVIGAGCAGLSAAIEATGTGCKRVVVIDREAEPGGVLRQCIHNGFGLHYYHEDLTGVQFASRLVAVARDAGIDTLLETNVLSITRERVVTITNRNLGPCELRAKAIVVATGCRERSIGALIVPGWRPAGIFTAGTAQRYLNLHGYLVGKNIVILGSGDIGLIMARQFALEGANVIAVAELRDFAGGLTRNIVQCLEDFDIPLYFRTTISKIEGRERVTGVWLAEVDEQLQPIEATARLCPCDTVVVSVGLIPENELVANLDLELDPHTGGPVVSEALETTCEGVFSCGNSLHVHDLVDFAALEGRTAGLSAARCAAGVAGRPTRVRVLPGRGVASVVPQRIDPTEGAAAGAVASATGTSIKLSFRSDRVFSNATIECRCGEKVAYRRRDLWVVPSEMQELVVPAECIASDLTLEITDG